MINWLNSRFLRAARPLLLAGAGAFAIAIQAQAAPLIEHWVAPTGAKVYFVESRALPIIDVQISFTGGSAMDPRGKEGLAGFTLAMLDAGTRTLNEQAISDRAADLGAIIGGGTDEDRSIFSLRMLSSDPEREGSLALAANLLVNPIFPPDVLQREKARAIAGLKEALTLPATIASRRFTSAVFGDHPYGRMTSLESLQAIEQNDLVAFHRWQFAPNLASIAIVGDIDRAGAERIAVQLTEALPVAVEPAPLPEPVQPEQTTLRISHPSAQSHVLVGQVGMRRDDPDYFPLLVGNYILGGGGFVSRLTSEVREKRGYAYSVYSYFDPRKVDGPFTIGLQTRGTQVHDALAVVDSILSDFVANGPTEQELRAARDFMVNGFGLRLDSNRKILDYVSMIGFYGLPLDWLETYPRAVEAVTVAQISDAFARRVRPENRVVVIVGGDKDQPTPEQTAPDE